MLTPDYYIWQIDRVIPPFRWETLLINQGLRLILAVHLVHPLMVSQTYGVS